MRRNRAVGVGLALYMGGCGLGWWVGGGHGWWLVLSPRYYYGRGHSGNGSNNCHGHPRPQSGPQPLIVSSKIKKFYEKTS